MSLLAQLPQVGSKKGWAWTKEVDPRIYDTQKHWPKISIVTPSYNQGVFLEETIRSILLQNYPNLEYIVMDGGSTDDSVKILKKYDKWITSWVSEKDKGQANAINKGITLCTGTIFNWINSDDYLAPMSLFYIARAFVKGASVAGKVHNFYQDNPGFKDIIQNSDLEISNFLALRDTFHQPGVWCDLDNIRQTGKFSESSSYYFDRIFFTKYFLQFPQVVYNQNVLVHFRYHESSKTIVIRDSKADELISHYYSLMDDPAYRNYKKELQWALDYQLLPEKRISQWEFDNIGKRLHNRLSSYAALLIRYPGLLRTRHYFTKLKRSVI